MSEYIKKEDTDTLVDELARAISDERCFMSRGRSTASIMQDILDLPTYSLPDSTETEREYIDKTELVRKLNAWDCKAHGIPNYAWRVINEMPTYSFPDSAKPQEWVIDFSNIKDAELEKIRAEIIQDVQNGMIQITKGSDRLFEIIDKHIEGEDK